ncbi:uncharacterized protein LOC141697861 isoform X1 [Apium graveolens]|uniref:uncharacterized protein LOC141697861 isoform X1 n=1 Tax=Apium graveolens TaxID=4045 RepID=UPI003D791879
MTMRETLAFVCKSRGGGSNYAELARRLEERKMQISNLLLSRHLYERTETETSKGNIEVSSNSLPPKDVEELMSSLKMDKLLIEEIRIRKGGYQFFFRFKGEDYVMSCIVAFKVMKSNLDALNISLQDFYAQLYPRILEYMSWR